MKKTVLITGASRGIGRAEAIYFSNEGWNVAINYINSEKEAHSLEEEIIALGGSAAAIRADITDLSQTKRLAEDTICLFGGLDALINNAGMALPQKLFTDTSPEEWDGLFRVNVKGCFNCCQAVLPYMIRKKRGKIINTSSIWGITGASCEVAYSATKAAIIGLTKALAKEVGPSGIQVNCVAPGVIDTQMNSKLSAEAWEQLKQETPLGVIGSGEDIAGCAYFLASRSGDFITGQVISPNGGILI